MQINIPSHLTDAELLSEVQRFSSAERCDSAHLVAHLAELDARRLYLGAGYSSLFEYCCKVLRLSEDAAYNRIESARAAKKFPVILAGLTDGSLNVTTVRLLARRLTPENHGELLAAASGRSKREVEELVARHYPQADVPSSVRKLPTRPAMLMELARPAVSTRVDGSSGPSLDAEGPSAPPEQVVSIPVVPPPPSTHRPVVAPLAPDRYLVKFTVSAATQEKLRLAQDLLRHANPSGDPAEIFDRALTLLLEDLDRKKFAATKRPRASRGVAVGSRQVAAQVKRAVAVRDERRCGFVGDGGHRCDERAFLEFHHVEAYAGGGRATVGMIELRCRAHNGYEAELYFSGAWSAGRSTRSGPCSMQGDGKRGS